MTLITATKLNLAALFAVLALVAVTAAPAEAIVPPKNCGTITVKSKRWKIVADQITCRTARIWAARYIRSYWRPSGYVCRRGPRGSSLWRTCTATRYNPDREYKIIRR